MPPSSEVHTFKKVIYDRVNDADVKVTATAQIAALYIRKQNIFTEKKIYPYVTDALVRKVNVDRYDDREIIKTNLVESYDLLMNFARKHLSDKFFLEGDNRISLRNAIAREMLVNTLIHREMTSSFIAKFVIEKDRMYVENASRASKDGLITPDNLEPNPKNPIIAAFFRNIGYSDQLGSGVRNLYKYTKFYSGKEPELKEGDVFRIIVPLDEEYSFDYEIGSETNGKTNGKLTENLTQTEQKILAAIRNNPMITQPQLAQKIGISVEGIRYAIRGLRKKGILSRIGSSRKGSWVIH